MGRTFRPGGRKRKLEGHFSQGRVGGRGGYGVNRRSAPRRRKGRLRAWRNIGLFETVNGNGISAGTHLEKEEMGGSFEDFVGALVGWAERRGIRGRTDKDKRGREEGRSNVRGSGRRG